MNLIGHAFGRRHCENFLMGRIEQLPLWSAKGRREIEHLTLDHWAGRRRDELLRILDELDQSIEQLSAAVEEAGNGREDVRRLMTHPGVGRIVALAFTLTVGPVNRFPGSKQLVSYLGLNPSERSSGGRQKFGAISKQVNRPMRTLLVDAAQTAARVEPNLRRHYQRLKFRKASAVAKVAIARKLAVRLYWMLRSQVDYSELVRMQGSSGGNLVDSHPSKF